MRKVRCPIGTRLLASLFATIFFMGVGTGAYGQSDPYKITAYEKAACATDAERLCADTYPDENRLLTCMKTNRPALTSICKVAFNAGIKRRHLN